MFDKFLMYWLLWLICIIVVFFKNSSPRQTWLIIWILSVISVSNTYFELVHLEISVSFVMILFGSFMMTAEPSFSFLQLFRAFILLLVYCTLLIWEMVAPVWFFLSSYFIIPVFIVLVAVMLNKRIKEVFGYLILGITLGQLLFDLLLYLYHIHNQIGMTYYFIHVGCSVLLLICIRFGFIISAAISSYLNRKLV